MNEAAIFHRPESNFCFAISTNEISIRLKISKFDHPDEIILVYGGKYDFQNKQQMIKMEHKFTDKLFSYYAINIKVEEVRFVYVFRIQYQDQFFYFSEDGLTTNYDFTLSFYNCFQFAYINNVDIMHRVDWLSTATFYQIFIDRFNIGNRNKDMSYINLKWGEMPNPKSFAGGDIKGITEKIPYLHELGINAIYLTPVFQSISNHKYDISDYYSIDEMFGNKDDLRELITIAHSRGIKIVLDAVFNHCSEKLKEFQDVLVHHKNSKYYHWFVIRSDDPFEYETFASCKYMPKFNTSNPEVCKYLLNIATYWIKEFDIDGWRLDVSDEVSHDFWRQFRKAVKNTKPNCAIIGENWHDANIYLQGDQFDSIMNYAFTKACLDFFAFDRFNAVEMSDKLNELLMRNTDPVNRMMLNLLDSHDTDRFLTRVNGNINKLMCAIALIYFYIGAACIYYGTENKMIGGFDPDCRRTFDWSLEAIDNPVKSLIRTLTQLKHNPDFDKNDIRIFSENDLLFIQRGNYQLIINESNQDQSIKSFQIISSNNYNNGILSIDGFIAQIK